MAIKPLSQFGFSLLFAIGIGSGAAFADAESTVPGNQVDTHQQSEVKLESSGQSSVEININSHSSQTTDAEISHSSDTESINGPISTKTSGLSRFSSSTLATNGVIGADNMSAATGNNTANIPNRPLAAAPSSPKPATSLPATSQYANSYQVGDSVFSAAQDDSIASAAGYRSLPPVASTRPAPTSPSSPVTGLLMQVKLWLSAMPIPNLISETLSPFTGLSTQLPAPTIPIATMLAVLSFSLLVSLYTGRLRRSGFSRAPRSDMAATIPFATPVKWALTVRYATQ
jgi:hypothetical protein